MSKKSTTKVASAISAEFPLAPLEGRFFFIGQGAKSRVLDGSVAEEVVKGLIQADFSNGHPIILVVSGPGGEVPATFAVADAIKMSRSPTVAIALGEVCSGHAHVFMSAKTRYMTESSQLMFHSPVCTERGTPEELLNSANGLAKSRHIIAKRLMQETSLSRAQIEEAMQTERFWDAAQCKKYGMSHGTITSWAPIAKHINKGA